MNDTGSPSWLGIIAALIAFVMAFVYMLEVRPELELEPLESAALSVFVGLLFFGALALMGAFTRDPRRGGGFLLGAGLGLLVMGLMGLLSIGLPLLVAGALALVEGFRRRPGSERPGRDEQEKR